MSISPDAIRPPAVAGRFYPADPVELTRQIRSLVQEVNAKPPGGSLLALVAPHAGYPFSGPTAAAAFKLAADLRVETVFVISPSHYDLFRGVSVYTGAGYRTPLGVVPVDRDRALALAACAPDVIHADEAGHREEHGIEVELPFLQHLLSPGWKLVPLVMGERPAALCIRLAEALLTVSRGAPALFVASSDLYHGYSYDACHASDERTLRAVERLDAEGFLQGLESDAFQACGGGPIAVVLRIAEQTGGCRRRLLAHTTSADVTGRRTGYMVGYGAVAVYTEAEPGGETGFDGERRLSAVDQEQLLGIAHRAIAEEVGQESQEALPPSGEMSARLHAPGGAFVTLKRGGELRGCIGQIHAATPLCQTVAYVARAAATRDPRFPAVRPDELSGLTVSVSVLNPLTPLNDVRDIRIGRHGLYIKRADRSGLLLPQVAEEHGWDAETFLKYTCLKAGLWSDAWRDPQTEVFLFTAEVFGEHEE
jgi:AmmeMemoRadiSam system protein B/AmmeMemoRadiSam system protein A